MKYIKTLESEKDKTHTFLKTVFTCNIRQVKKLMEPKRRAAARWLIQVRRSKRDPKKTVKTWRIANERQVNGRQVMQIKSLLPVISTRIKIFLRKVNGKLVMQTKSLLSVISTRINIFPRQK